MNAWESAVPKVLRLMSPLLLATFLLEPAWAQLGMTNPVTAPDEPCYLKISDPSSTNGQLLLPDAYKLPPPEFLVNSVVNPGAYFNITTPNSLQTDSLHPFLRYYAQVAAGKFMGKVPYVLPSQVLVDAVRIYLGMLPIGTTTSGAPLDPRDWASRLAQLAVTGRKAYYNFSSWHPQDADLIQLVQKTNPSINQANLQQAVKFVLDASYSALWAIRSNDPAWRAQRAQMGWIAVSGEDDTPHRPVNVPTAPYPQYDLLVSVGVPFGTVKAVARYMVASYNAFIGPDAPPVGFPPLPQPSSGPSSRANLQISGIVTRPVVSGQIQTAAQELAPIRRLPVDGLPSIPPGNKIIIYIHGGGSRLEEAVPMANNLILEGMRPGPKDGIGNQDYTVISLDLPNSAYGSSFDPSCVYGNCNPPLNQYQPLPNYPILMFEKQYVLNFIDALDVAVGNIKNRIVAFMGGSLGGNLSLILGGLYTGGNPYLKTVVAWSPTAMLKTSGLSNLVVSSSWLGNLNPTNWGLENGPQNRTDYFNKLYFQPISPELGIPPDPEMWFRADWPGYATTNGASDGAVTINLNTNQQNCERSNITQSRFDRYEIYSQEIRRWTTAIDLEQAMYDFRNPGQNGRPLYLDIPARVLLATGEKDNYGDRYNNPGGAAKGALAGAGAGALAGLALGGPIGAGVFGIVGGVVGLVYGSGAPTLNNVDIYGYTHDVANFMVNTPGRTLFIKDTGHSIHNERPQFFAQEIVDFLKTHDTTLQVNVGAGGTGLRWNSQVWAVLSTKSNQGGLTLDLNAMWHPWNQNPPATDNPCGVIPTPPCNRVGHFGFAPNSQNSFYIGLSRTGINFGDIGGLGIQFIGGALRTSDTPDHFDLTVVGLNAWGLNGLIGPLGMGTMLNATGSSSAPAGQPLKTLMSPQDLWQTTNITAPQPPPPTFAVRLSSGTDANGPFVYVKNRSNEPPQVNNYWTQVPTWFQVNLLDASNNSPVQGNVAVQPIPPPYWPFVGQSMEGFDFGVLPNGYDSGLAVLPNGTYTERGEPTARKVYYMCLPAGTPIALPNGASLGSLISNTGGRPPNLRSFPGNQQGCSISISASGYSDCVLQLGQVPTSSGGILGGLLGGSGTSSGRPCQLAPSTGGVVASVQNNTTASSNAGTIGQHLQVQLPALSVTVCTSVDGKSCTSNTNAPWDIVAVTSGGTPVGGANLMAGQQSLPGTNASGMAVISRLCYPPASQVAKIGQTTVPVRTPIPCGQRTATASMSGYQPFTFTLP